MRADAGSQPVRRTARRPVSRAVERGGLDWRLVLDRRLDGADLYVDRRKFDRLLVNLLSNAVTFTPEGSIEVRTEHAGDAFRLTVADTYAGIVPDLRQLPLSIATVIPTEAI